jgi:glycerate kinase
MKFKNVNISKILIAPNAFKGSLSPLKACRIIQKAINKNFKAKTLLMPVSDGGDGLTDALMYHFKGKCVTLQVYDSLFNKIKSGYCILPKKIAVIETARACGLGVLKSEKLKPLDASSYGAGQLISNALKKNAKKIYIGLGGSATNDGGAGLASALGVKFLDKFGSPLPFGVRALARLAKIDLSNLDKKVKKTKIYAISDVKNPILGRYGSAKVYGPQKGANSKEVNIMADALKHYCKIIRKDLKKDIGLMQGTAAAGAIAAGVFAFLGAKIVQGSDFVLKLINTERKIKECDLVITGEGTLDRQTFFGKAPYAICKLAKKYKKPVLFIAGINKIKNAKILKDNGITLAVQMAKNKNEIHKSIKNPEKYLQKAVISGLTDTLPK